MNPVEWAGTGAAMFAAILLGSGVFGPQRIGRHRGGRGRGRGGTEGPASWTPDPGGRDLPAPVDDLDAELAALIDAATGGVR